MAAPVRMPEALKTQQHDGSNKRQSMYITSGETTTRNTPSEAVSNSGSLPDLAQLRYCTESIRIDREIGLAGFDRSRLEKKSLEAELDLRDRKIKRQDSDLRLIHRAKILAEIELREKESERDREMEEKDLKITILEEEIQATEAEEARDLKIERLESTIRLLNRAKVNAEDKLREKDEERDREMKEKDLDIRSLKEEVKSGSEAMASLRNELDQRAKEMELKDNKIELKDREIERRARSYESDKAWFDEQMQLKDQELGLKNQTLESQVRQLNFQAVKLDEKDRLTRLKRRRLPEAEIIMQEEDEKVRKRAIVTARERNQHFRDVVDLEEEVEAMKVRISNIRSLAVKDKRTAELKVLEEDLKVKRMAFVDFEINVEAKSATATTTERIQPVEDVDDLEKQMRALKFKIRKTRSVTLKEERTGELKTLEEDLKVERKAVVELEVDVKAEEETAQANEEGADQDDEELKMKDMEARRRYWRFWELKY